MPDSGRYESVSFSSVEEAQPHIREIDEDMRRSWVSTRSVRRLAVVGSLAAAGVYYTKTRSTLLDAGQGAAEMVEVLPVLPSALDASDDDSSDNTFTSGLKASLTRISESDNFLFGHHMSSYSGQHFWDKQSQHHYSDVENSTGKFPLVYGFDFAKVLDNDGDFVQHVEDAYTRGGVMSFMWLTPNPATGGDSYDKTGRPCVNILDGGSSNAVWTAYLDSISDFLHEIHPIPVVFRLFHEMTGWWYWWGTDHCTDDEFITAWQYTVEYLRETKGNDNLLMFYATSRIANDFTPKQRHEVKVSMYDRYPGDDYVDAIGFDCYDNLTYYAQSLNNTCEEIFSFANEKGKIPLIGETGHTHGMECPDCGEWFESLLTVMKDPMSKCSQAAYAITWENYNTGNYYVPLPSQKQYAGFMDFIDSGVPLLQHSPEWHGYSWDNGYFQNESEAGNWDNIQSSGGDDGNDAITTISTTDDTATDTTVTDDTTTGLTSGDDTGTNMTNSCGKGCTDTPESLGNSSTLYDDDQKPSEENFEPASNTPTADSHPSLGEATDDISADPLGEVVDDSTTISPDDGHSAPDGTDVGDARPDGTIIGAIPSDDVGDDFTDVSPEPDTETVSCGKGCTTQSAGSGTSGDTSITSPVIPDDKSTLPQKRFDSKGRHRAPK